jgi:hypothetical protein
MKIAHIAPLTYTPGKLEYHQFIRGGVGADYHQGPSLYQFPEGDVLLRWGAYDFDECSNNLVTLFSVSQDRCLTWSDPQVYMADFPGGPTGGTLLRLRDGRSTLMLVQQTRHDEIEIDPDKRIATRGSNYFKSRTRIFIRRSQNGGRSFDHGEELPYETITRGASLPEVGFYGSVDELFQMENGRIVAAFMYLDPERSDTRAQQTTNQHYTGGCLLSDDEGKTWRPGGRITADTQRGVMEMQIAETDPMRLFCLFRTKGGCLYQTISTDGGESWSTSTPSPLPAPESMARMIKLQNGELLVVWNNISSTTQQPRHPLSAVLSTDGGRSWGEPCLIADETGSNQLSNHGMIQLDDGRIVLGVSHYRSVRPMTSDLDVAIFDREWLVR